MIDVLIKKMCEALKHGSKFENSIGFFRQGIIRTHNDDIDLIVPKFAKKLSFKDALINGSKYYDRPFKSIMISEVYLSLSIELDNLGFRGFSFFGKGSSALVLYTSCDQLVRIVNVRDEVGRAFLPNVLQTKYSNLFKGEGETILLEILTCLDTSKNNDALQRKLEKSFEFLGCSIDDLNTYNYGTIYDPLTNTDLPLLFDSGELRSKVYGEPTISPKVFEPWTTSNGTWKQKKLTPQRIWGTIGRLQIKSIERIERELAMTIESERWYVTDCLEFMLKCKKFNDETKFEILLIILPEFPNVLSSMMPEVLPTPDISKIREKLGLRKNKT